MSLVLLFTHYLKIVASETYNSNYDKKDKENHYALGLNEKWRFMNYNIKGIIILIYLLWNNLLIPFSKRGFFLCASLNTRLEEIKPMLEGNYEPNNYRDYVIERYGVNKVLDELEKYLKLW